MTRPSLPIRLITPADVRASISRARRSLERAAEEIVWQIEMEAWRTLGYPSWSAMREAEYGGAAFMVPAKNRPELVARIHEAGLSKREAARTAGVDEGTVRNDLRGLAGAENSAPDDDVIDAEIVDDEPALTDEECRALADPADLADGDADAPQKATDPAPAESVVTVTCPTCHGTGKVTR